MLPIQTILGLLTCNLIWSLHPIMGKWLLEDFTPSQVAWIRYFGAFFSYLIFILVLHFKKHKTDFFIFPKEIRPFFLAALMGFMTFCFSPLLQLKGLASSLASENAIIIAMEPLITVLLAALFLAERIGLVQWASLFIAFLGFVFLSGLSNLNLIAGLSPANGGNLLILISLFGEASYSVLGRNLISRFSPIPIFGTSLLIGILFLTGVSWFHSDIRAIFQIHHWNMFNFLAAIWLGPIGTTFTYLYFLYVLQKTQVVRMTVFLFIQPVMGTLWGYLFFSERLGVAQLIGSLLILTGILLPQLIAFLRKKLKVFER